MAAHSSNSSSSNRSSGSPSLIDFEGPSNPFEIDNWRRQQQQQQPATAAASNADFRTPESVRSSNSSASSSSQQFAFATTPFKSPQNSPDFLTGDFPVTPPTTLPGVRSAIIEGGSREWAAFPDPFGDTPFSAASSNASVSSFPPSKPSQQVFHHSQSTPELESSGKHRKQQQQPLPEQQLTSKYSAPAGTTVVASPLSQNGRADPCTPTSGATSRRRPSEFLASGGGKGAFKPPARGPVDPDRPVPFDLRPSPMRPNQVARTLVFIDGAVWVACDGALKVWDVCSAMGEGSGGQGNPPDDVDAAKFTYIGVDGAVTHCLVPDPANKLVWTGHKDGKVRAWSTELSKTGKRRSEASICWLAHRSPVFSMVITSFGELWTGSEGGGIRAWPWDVTAHCLVTQDAQMAASLMARSFIDLRARGTAAGATSLPNTDVHFLVADHANGRVWSGGPLLLALWDARTRDVLKVFGPSVQSEFSSPEISPVRDSIWDDDNKSKNVKKEKAGTFNFLQRVMGAADAVRRAAGGGQAGDDSKKLEAIVATVEGTIWGGYASGMLVQWDSLGNRLQGFLYLSVPVRSLCVVGTRIWVGYADGRLQVLSDTGKVLGVWIAHSSAILQMAKGSSYIFTLAAHGGIRGWNIGSPCPIDGILQLEMQSKAETYTDDQNFKVLAGTWNVAEERASLKSMQAWLAGAAEAGVVFVGLQETEMGAGAIAFAAAKETVGFQEKNSANGQWWLDSLGAALGNAFMLVGWRQLAGILIGVWVRNELLPYVGEVDAAAVPCGFGRALGNKGGVGVKVVLFRRTFCFLSSHFAAHMDAVSRRNADFEHIFHQMKFSSTGAPVSRGVPVRKVASPETHDMTKEIVEPDAAIELLPDMADADMIVWVGDFNYRIDELSYEDVIDMISVRQWDVLVLKDQLRAEMSAGRVFQGMREGPLRFQPTYKFGKGSNHSLGYDSSEKKRIPAWCDRVIFRDSFDGHESIKKGKLSHPVSAAVLWYDSCMDVAESDHKPVGCLLNVDVAVINEAARRRAFFELMQSNSHVLKWVEQLNTSPEMVLNTDKIYLEDGVPSVLKAINESSRQAVVFQLQCQGEPGDASSGSKLRRTSHRAAFGFPFWLQVLPASGMIPPKGNFDITLRYMTILPEDFTESGRPMTVEDSRGKVVILTLSCKSPLSSTWKNYQVFVHSPSIGQGAQERETKFRLQRSDVLASRLDSAKDLLL